MKLKGFTFYSTFWSILCIVFCCASPALADNDSINDFLAKAEARRKNIAKTMEQSTVFIFYRSGDDSVGMGSGFVIADGYVLSNGHVIEGGTDIYIAGKDFKPVKAKVIDLIENEEIDFALLSFDPPIDLPILPFNLETTRTDRVTAWGFPYLIVQMDRNMDAIESGSNSNVPPVVSSEGTISTKLQRASGKVHLIHTAPISGGNSGGPLINSRGEVVGINTWTLTEDGARTNIAQVSSEAIKFIRKHGIEPLLAPNTSEQSLALLAQQEDEQTPSMRVPREQTPDTSPTDKANMPSSEGLTDYALETYPQAVEGNAYAQAYLGASYWTGDEAPENLEYAVYWLRKSVEQANPIGKSTLGMIYLTEQAYRDPSQGIKYLKEATKEEPDYASVLAFFCLFGEAYGVEQDYQAAFDAAKIGEKVKDKDALAILAFFYFTGDGNIEVDYDLALKYVKQSEDNALSNAVLSWMYLHGNAVPEDDAKAFEYAQKAADNGDTNVALGLLAYYYQSGIGVEQDYKKALEYAESASEYFSELGFFVLGTLYANGDGIEKDYIKAWAYFDLADKKNIDSAGENRDEIGKHLSKEKLDAAQELVRSLYAQNGLKAK